MTVMRSPGDLLSNRSSNIQSASKLCATNDGGGGARQDVKRCQETPGINKGKKV
jgi:hypothetical protein